RAMTTPWNAWTRERLPSTTLTLTLSVSPGRNSGTSLRSDAASTLSSVCMMLLLARHRSDACSWPGNAGPVSSRRGAPCCATTQPGRLAGAGVRGRASPPEIRARSPLWQRSGAAHTPIDHSATRAAVHPSRGRAAASGPPGTPAQSVDVGSVGDEATVDDGPPLLREDGQVVPVERVDVEGAHHVRSARRGPAQGL